MKAVQLFLLVFKRISRLTLMSKKESYNSEEKLNWGLKY